MKFKFVMHEEHQITIEVEAESKAEARQIAEDGKGTVIDRKSEYELQDY